MKISIDKNNTVVSLLPLVKEKIKEFKSYFTEGDLLRMFNESTDRYLGGEIIKCDIEAYAMFSLSEDVTFYVEIVLDEIVCFDRISFFINYENGSFSFHDDRTVTVKTYDQKEN